MKIAFLGDIHSHLNLVHEFIKTHPYVDAVFQVGDFGIYRNSINAKRGSDWKGYKKKVKETLENKKRFKRPVYFCKGNNEDWDNLNQKSLVGLNINYLPNGNIIRLGSTNIGVLGGIYSPSKFKTKSSLLKGRDKRFFTKEDIKKINDSGKNIDILVSHLGASKFLPGFLKGGSHHLKKLVVKVKPKWYIHGHHHYNYYSEYNETKIQGLGLFPKSDKSYKILDV